MPESHSPPMILGQTRGADLPVLDDLEGIVQLTRDRAPLYIRYSEGPDRDREGPSTDYECGLRLPGLSVTVLTPPAWWSRPRRDWVARRICKYADLMVAPRRPRPWLLVGRQVGTGADHEPLIAEALPVGWVGPAALAEANRVHREQFIVGRDSRWLPARPVAVPRDVNGLVVPSEGRCPFCFPAAVAPNQLLAVTEHFYLLAPVGQLVEGFLGVMTHVCGDHPVRLRCLDDVPAAWAHDLHRLQRLIARFHHDVYGMPTLFYEHGRGGDGSSSPPEGGYVFHPHLCALPGDHRVHMVLARRFSHRAVPHFPDVRDKIGRQPYLYVHTPSEERRSRPVAYFGTDAWTGESISALSVKRLVAEVGAIRQDCDWRRYPGESELVRLIAVFNQWYAATFRRQADPHLEHVLDVIK
jgi:hypothetical protein